MYRINKDRKIQSLLQTPQKIFTANDLAVLWGIKNKNNLWKTLSRYADSGILIRIHRGLYSKVPIEALKEEELGCALMGPFSYVSLETVLARAGILFQEIYGVTLVGQSTKEYEIAGTRYICKQMKNSVLLNRAGIQDLPTYSIASSERAAIDLEYYNSAYYLDNPEGLDSEELKKIQKEMEYI